MNAINYQSVKGSRLSDEDAVRYGEHIAFLIEERGGALSPETLVEDGESQFSPLHDVFEWDDELAAHKYRLEQARHLLRSIEVVVEGEATPIRAFHNVLLEDEERDDGRVYVTIERAMSEEPLREQVIERALGELIGWRKRYEQYQEFSKVFSAIEQVEMAIA